MAAQMAAREMAEEARASAGQMGAAALAQGEAALAARAIPVEVHRFAGEGHGFRDGGVQVRVLEASEAFFRRHFALASP